MVEALIGVVVGAGLGLLSALAIEAWRDRRRARAAAAIIHSELVGISLVASAIGDDPYPMPFRDEAWRSHSDRLIGSVSSRVFAELASFYVANDLVRMELIDPPSGSQIGEDADQLGTFLRRFRMSWRVRVRHKLQGLRERGTSPAHQDEAASE